MDFVGRNCGTGRRSDLGRGARHVSWSWSFPSSCSSAAAHPTGHAWTCSGRAWVHLQYSRRYVLESAVRLFCLG
jgi:hypothetical protein